MSRHRNVRSMNYSEEYEGFDDVYGHSVEDDYCVSPSVAEQFIYDRNKRQQMSAFLGQEEEIAEEDEDEEEEDKQIGGIAEPSKSNIKGLNLSDIDQARLQSCLEEVRNVIGDSVTEQTLLDAALSCDFSVEKVLNMVLNNATENKDNSGALKPMKADTRREKDDCSSCNSYHSPIESVEYKNVEQLMDPVENVEQQGSRNIGSIVFQSSNLSPELSAVQIGAETASTSNTNSSTDSSQTKSNISSLSSLNFLSLDKVNKDSKADVDSISSNIGKDRTEIGRESESSIGTCSGIRKTDKLMYEPDLKSGSESEEDDFSSLCSLVIHNQKRSLGCAELDRPVLSGKVPSLPMIGKGIEIANTTPKPFDLPKSHLSSDSEEDDFSSLCSLVVHNRSSSEYMNPEASSFEVHESTPNKVPQDKNTQQKVVTVPRMPHKLFQESDSDSEDENFSSLCSLVISNRCHHSEDTTKIPCKEPNLSGASGISGKGPRECSLQPIPEKKCAEHRSEQSSDSEEDNFSSLCSLVIHNRNNPNAIGKNYGPINVPPLKESKVERERSEVEHNEIHNDPKLSANFVIPPLRVKQNIEKGMDSLERKKSVNSSVDSSNQCSEDEDYMIDLCGTVKTMELSREYTIKEEMAENEVVESIPPDFMSEENVFGLSLSDCRMSDTSKYSTLLDISTAKISPFGRILCRQWDCLIGMECPRSQKDLSVNKDIAVFLFDSESPDDICRRLRSQKYLVKVEDTKTET